MASIFLATPSKCLLRCFIGLYDQKSFIWARTRTLAAESRKASGETERGRPLQSFVKVLSKQAEARTLHGRGELWTSLRHPNVLQTFGVSPMDADPLYIVTQSHPHNVLEFLERNPQVDRAKIVHDVALGMRYLHTRGVVHGSLKPPNVLVGFDGQACVGDYGMAEVQTSGSYGHRYFSPEAWKTLSRPSDVFAWAMTSLEIFTSRPPWGILSEKQIFRLVVKEDSRPDRPDEDFGLTDHIWGIMEESWHQESRLRPTFEILVQLLQNRPETGEPVNPGENLASVHAHRTRTTLSMITQASGPPAYEAPSSTFSHPESAPPAVSKFPRRAATVGPPALPSNPPATLGRAATYDARTLAVTNSSRPANPDPAPRPPYLHDASDASSSSASPYDSFDEDGMSPMFNNALNLGSPDTTTTSWAADRRLASSPSVRTSSSGGSSRSQNSNPRSAPHLRQRFGPIGEEPSPPFSRYPRSVPSSPSPTPRGYSKGTLEHDPGALRHVTSNSTFPSQYTSDNTATLTNTYAESILSQPSTLNNGTAPNASLLAGALLSEVKEGRKQDVIDSYLYKIQKLGRRSHKDAEKLVTAGTIPTLILLLKSRAVEGIGLENVLTALGILTHDPITANTIYRTSLVSGSHRKKHRSCAWVVKAQSLQNLLVTKGLKGGKRSSRISGWCIGVLIRTDNIAEMLADIGLVSALCEHMRRCRDSLDATAEDYCAVIYAVARVSRSIKISKALAKGGCVEMLAHFLITTEDSRVLSWCARAVGCLMRPNSSDMAISLLNAGVARGLARLPNLLSTEEVEPLGSFAFAIQRFSCAEWGSGTRKALVDAGVVDSLLAALRTAADEPCAQVHIELAHAIALLSDVGGSSIRKEIVNAGGIDILKRVGASASRADVTKACTLAATSITGNVWSRNAASAKAAFAHEWIGGCPDYLPECPLPLDELDLNEIW
ncbi:hypothetical protein FB45DRAFT_1022109 [Roridomyces roridus]|uniref:Protein kinase domain-containing protein n=1 Tax=Roridomyces roridus TaxID=1738132 RepID=A0AAD7C7F8_9AGAR|nr:hypothetical protein FB45DRAFT_1022109 [Roridomyces roridus]